MALDLKARLELPESSIEAVARIYRETIAEVSQRFLMPLLVRGRTRSANRARLSLVLPALRGPEEKALGLASQLVRQSFEASASSMDQDLGVYPVRRGPWDRMRSEIVESILMDPSNGLVPTLAAVWTRLHKRLQAVERRSAIEATAIRAGLSDAWLPASRSFARASDKAMSPLSRRSALGVGVGRQGVVQAIADVHFHTSSRGREAIEDYVYNVVRNTLAETIALARRWAMLRRGEESVVISFAGLPSSPCSLYSGKVFSLREGVEGIPISRLPAGGVPFHPGCSHLELPFRPLGITDPGVLAAMRVPPPRWALGRHWSEVASQYRIRDSEHALGKFNGAWKALRVQFARDRSR